MRQDELVTLRDNLKRARKLLASSPRDLRPEREAEVELLALAVKRAESSVNRDKRERVEREALSAITKEERDKREKGKRAYWLKNGMPFHLSPAMTTDNNDPNS
jgi:ribosomal RNA-processing protein 36